MTRRFPLFFFLFFLLSFFTFDIISSDRNTQAILLIRLIARRVTTHVEAMAERRVLCLLGPCRVNGVGGYDGDLRGLDGVDAARPKTRLIAEPPPRVFFSPPLFLNTLAAI